MKKDYTRDYATAAFHFWALEGFPAYEDAKEKIYIKAIQNYKGTSPEGAAVYAEEVLEKAAPELLDIFAANETFRLLKEYGREDVAAALRAVYCLKGELSRGEISRRVIAFSASYHAGEATVYRWLRYARELFASLRGLRLEKRGRGVTCYKRNVDSSGFASM